MLVYVPLNKFCMKEVQAVLTSLCKGDYLAFVLFKYLFNY